MESFSRSAAFTLMLVMCSWVVRAQGIDGVLIDPNNAVTRNPSAAFQAHSNSQGFMVPHVALSATNAAGPIASPATSLLVWNTATAGTAPNNVTPGYYYNAGTPASPQWRKLTGGAIGNGTLNYVPKWTPDGSTVGNSQLFDNATNVAVGHAGLIKKIDVLTGTSSEGIVIRSATTATNVAGHLWPGSGGFVVDARQGNLTGATNLHLRTGGTDRLLIDGTSGNVGIGTGAVVADHRLRVEMDATVPQLSLYNPGNATGKLAGVRLGTAGPGWDLQLRTVQSTDWLQLTDGTGTVQHAWNGARFYPGFTSSNGTNTGYITGNGTNVGVATTAAPSAKLEVLGASTGSAPTIRAGGGGDFVLNSGGSLFFDGNYSYAAGNYIRPMAANTQAFFTAGTERMRITNAGLVGIATTAPAERLHVVGNIRQSTLAGTGAKPVYADANGTLVQSIPVASIPARESFTSASSSTYAIAWNNTGTVLNLTNLAGGTATTVARTMDSPGNVLITATVTATAGDGNSPTASTGNISYAVPSSATALNEGLAGFRIELQRRIGAGAWTTLMTSAAWCGIFSPSAHLIANGQSNFSALRGDRFSFPGTATINFIDNVPSANTYEYRLMFVPGSGTSFYGQNTRITQGAYYISDRVLNVTPLKF